MSESDERFQQHAEAVSRFLGELHATMIDPCAEGEVKVEDMQRQLLEAARSNRQALYDAHSEIADLKRRLHYIYEDWQRLRKERWSNVVATGVFQSLKHDPQYRRIMNLLADGQISAGKCAEAVAEVAAGCTPSLPEWRGYESELSWKERYERKCEELDRVVATVRDAVLDELRKDPANTLFGRPLPQVQRDLLELEHYRELLKSLRGESGANGAGSHRDQ